ncbi:MAG: NUDIX hydrolase, partial [Propionibacteriaceae bacterium]|nr:NUDIX hydrolase [Propionibacteriaceae bacterium]
RQYRHPVGYRLVEIPAGLMDHVGENPLEAAQRELSEEVGLSADTWLTLTDTFSSPGAHEENLRVFLATELHPVSRPEDLDFEEADMQIYWADRSALVDAILAGQVQSPSLVYGVLALNVAVIAGRLPALRPANAPWPARQEWVARHALQPGG